MYNIDSEGRL